MKKIKLLIIGNSSFVKRRVIPSLKKNKKIKYCICSKSSKIDSNNKILYNNYQDALKDFKPELVYVSTINPLHFGYAKKILKKGFNLIVDKPVAPNLKKTKELLKIAKEKKLFFAEATLFNYHRIFVVIKKLCGSLSKVNHIQSNLNHPLTRTIKEVKKIQGDCESDMSVYAAAILRLFTKNKITNLHVNRNYFKNTNVVKNFYITSSSKDCTYFGNFALQKEYTQQIIFYTKDKIIYSPQRIFALPFNKDLELIVKTKNKIKKIKVKKDDCIGNFFKLSINAIKDKKYNFFYNIMLEDAIIRSNIKNY